MVGMNDLPFDISANIFSRLHVDLVLDCKLVCKTWRNLIKNPSFAQSHLARRKLLLKKLEENHIHQDFSIESCETFQSGFLSLGEPRSNDRRLHYVEYDVNFKRKSCEIKNKTINIPPIKNTYPTMHMIGSCNGLVCSTVYHHKLNDPIHICNPVTREYVYLPRYTSEDKCRAYWMKSGFGYIPLTDEYKVIRIFCKDKLGDGRWCFQVYTLGKSNKWTEEKEIPYPLFHRGCRYSNGVLVNEEIYWMGYSSKIVAFSLADEEFRDVAWPPLVESPYDRNRLCVYGNWLCLVHHITRERNIHVTHVDIWLLKRSNDMNVQRNGTCSWNKEFTVQAKTSISLIPLAFTMEGKVLFWQDREYVSCYDLRTAVLKKLRKDENNDEVYLEPYQAAHHINSFVSLKALGVKNCRRRLKYMVK